MPTALSWTETTRAIQDVGHLLWFRRAAVRRRVGSRWGLGIIATVTVTAAIRARVPRGLSHQHAHRRRPHRHAVGVGCLPADQHPLRHRVGRWPRAALAGAGRDVPRQPHHRPPGRAAADPAERRVAGADLGPARVDGVRQRAGRSVGCPARPPALDPRRHLCGAGRGLGGRGGPQRTGRHPDRARRRRRHRPGRRLALPRRPGRRHPRRPAEHPDRPRGAVGPVGELVAARRPRRWPCSP